MSNEVPAVSAAIRILERIAAEMPRTVSSGMLASELGLNRSTCYNILATLEKTGWAIKVGERGGWNLGPNLLSLTGVSQGSVDAVVQEEIDELSRQLGFVVFAVQQDASGGYTVVASADPRRGVRVTVDVGDRFPFSAPALMHAFYAYRPWEQFLAMARSRIVEKYTDLTVTDPGELTRVFDTVRSRAYSTSVRQYNAAQGAAASAVFDREGKPILVIGSITFSSELDDESVHPAGRMLAVTADRITARTGGLRPRSTAVTAEA